MSKLTAIDLFAGCGGLTQGLKDAGFSVIGAVEVDSSAIESYELNHPDVYLWKQDIRTLSTRDILDKLSLKRGDLSILAGCPPCQGFSTMRTLNGRLKIVDERNDLINDFIRLAEGLLPKAIMMENVPGLMTDSRLVNALQRLEALGYFIDWNNLDRVVRILDAANFGVPQRRRRMILMTSSIGPIPFALSRSHEVTVRTAIAGLPSPERSKDPLHNIHVKRSEKVLAIIRAIPKDGGSRSSLQPEQQLKCHAGFDGFKDVYGRMAWDSVAPTITSGCINPSKGRFLHPEQDRAITLREAALLQTFPPSYKFSLKKGRYSVAAQIGNALPPEFIKRHALSVVEYLNSTSDRSL